MSHTTDESDQGRISRNQSGLSLTDEENCSGDIMGWGAALKKGPWTAAEDALLVDYVKNYGEGNWNAVQKHSGLSRCGKSCRLRWANHLRPNLKKGSFTADEERVIIELHAKMGNKWARMAAHLPGRTDNEIKNYWNTRIKRRQRSGAPLYPPEVFLQAYPEYQNQTTDRFSGGNKRHLDLLQTNNYGSPHDLSTNSYCNFTAPTISGHKRWCNSTHLYSSQDGKVRNGLHQFNQFQYDPCNENKSCCGLSFPYDPDDPSTKYHSPFGAIQGIHSLNNGKFSASMPSSEAVKWELPSLQYSETDFSSWGTLPLVAPSLESVDTDSSLQSPLMGTLKSEIYSPRNSGLLEALLDEAKTLGSATKPSSNKSSGSSAVTPCDITDTSKLNLSEVEWEEYAESFSTFDHSASMPSIFNDCTPITGGGKSLEEHSPANIPGKRIKSEPVDQAWAFDREKEILTCSSRPDALLGSGWLEQCTANKGNNAMSDPISRLLGSDCGSDYKYIVSGIFSPSQDHERAFSCCTWDNMPTARQMFDFP